MTRAKTVVLAAYTACIIFPRLASAPPVSLCEVLPRYGDILERVSERHGVDPRLLVAIVTVESRWRHHVVRCEPRLRRLRWAREVVERHGLDPADPRVWRSYGLAQVSYLVAVDLGYCGEPEGLLDPEVCLDYAARRLAQSLRHSGGDLERALYGYCPSRRYIVKVMDILR